jgi:hypothetical protein
MKRLSFNIRFINDVGDDLVPGKIHTIRQNYDHWKKFEGRDLELFTWEGTAYRKGSRQKVFCLKRLVSVQRINHAGQGRFCIEGRHTSLSEIIKNDGFKSKEEFIRWFIEYPPGEFAVLQFTDFRY